MLDPDQKKALDIARSGASLFISGGAGVGKSHCLKQVITELSKLRGASHVFVCASTGMAALNLDLPHARTVHSFAGIGLGEKSKEELAKLVRMDARAQRRWRAAQVLIIDEISQMSGELLDKLEFVARKSRPRSTAPFGGLQMILCGDFAQLGPVSGDYAFQCRSWQLLFRCKNSVKSGHIICLRTCHRIRERDRSFARFLNELRFGDISKDAIKWFRQHHIDDDYNESKGREQLLRLVSTNKEAEEINQAALATARELRDTSTGKSELPIHTFVAQHSTLLAESEIKTLTRIPLRLHLWVGAEVMLLHNIDTASRLVNGACGRVVRIMRLQGERCPVVRFRCGDRRWQRTISPTRIELRKDDQEVGFLTQVPLSLAYAATIHKVQGIELDRALIDLRRIFANGQAYTALSRLISSQGLYLAGDFDYRAIRISFKVKKFLRDFCSRGVVFGDLERKPGSEDNQESRNEVDTGTSDISGIPSKSNENMHCENRASRGTNKEFSVSGYYLDDRFCPAEDSGSEEDDEQRPSKRQKHNSAYAGGDRYHPSPIAQLEFVPESPIKKPQQSFIPETP